MNVNFDFRNDTICIYGQTVTQDSFRNFVIDNYPYLVKKHVTKSILRTGVVEIVEGNTKTISSAGNFIGIAEMYGFDGEDVLNYIDLAPDIYKKRKATFIRAHQEVQKRIASGLPAAQDFKNKIYVKTGLVQNYIRLHYNGEGYITYRDLLK